MVRAEDQALVVPGKATPRGRFPHVRVAGDLIFVSGTSSRRLDDSIAGAVDDGSGVRLDIVEQTRAVITNVDDVLRAVGATLADAVQITTFLVSMDDFRAYNDVYAELFDEMGPARTTVAVKELPHPHLLIEMQVVAVRHSGKGAS